MSDPADILNWYRVTEQITSSGQPDAAQMAQIAALGVQHVINLGPHHNKDALDGEPQIVADLGMRYHYIPVEFDAPTQADYTAFRAAMAEIGDVPVHVHCIYNARVSAFLLRYAEDGASPEAPADAAARMEDIWRPGSVWSAFLGKDCAPDTPNAYKGYDYE